MAKDISSSDQPIILAGCYRSGTTLVRNLINNHPRIYCGPEVKFFEDFHGTFLNDPLKHRRFFRTLKTLDVPARRLLRLFGQTYIKSISIATNRMGKRRWAEKNPENCIYMQDWDYLLKENFQYVFIARHPLDILASLMEVGFTKSLPKSFDGKLNIIFDFISKGYKYYLDHPEKSYLIRYEDLLASPEKELEKLFDFLGEKFDPSIVDKTFQDSARKGIGDPKFKKTTEIHSNSLERWKNDLSSEQLSVASSQLSQLISDLGYSIY